MNINEGGQETTRTVSDWQWEENLRADKFTGFGEKRNESDDWVLKLQKNVWWSQKIYDPRDPCEN